MSDGFTGKCLCGAVTFESSSDAQMQASCHCDDCRRSSGSTFASMAFVPADALTVTGKTATYEHTSDRGSAMTKTFCPSCGTTLFTDNDANPGRRGVRVGTIDDASWFKPKAYVYCSQKLPSTVLDPDAKTFDKMPG